MQQAIDSAEINKRAVVSKVLDHAGQNRAFLQVLQGLRSLFMLLAFQHLLARDHDVAAFLIQLDDGNFEDLTLDRVDIASRTKIGLGAGEKRLRPIMSTVRPPLMRSTTVARIGCFS